MGTNEGKPAVEGKKGSAPEARERAGDKERHNDDTDTRNFIETHNVTKVSRKAGPGSGEESADLLKDAEADPGERGN